MASKTVARVLALALAVTLVAACGSSTKKGSSTPTTAAQKIDYKKLGLWDDGPCDPSKPPLKVGLMTVFESPVISLKDQATALEASAKAFNARGGANGSCIQVTTCDDKATTDGATACARQIDSAGVVATINDQGTAGQAEVAAAMEKAGIPRVAENVTNVDWGDPNAYPLDGSGTGSTFLLPETLIQNGVKKLGDARVDLAAASALKSLLSPLYQKLNGATITYDVPVPAGTTDYSQFILGAQSAGVGGLFLPLGNQEAVQIVKAGQQLGTNLKLGSTLGTFAQKDVADLGDFAKNMTFIWSYPPATANVPVYQALRADLAASGDSNLQPEKLVASPMRSWIGLYALLKMIRDSHLTNFTRADITAMLKKAKNVPMLGIFGGENWTPDTNHPGLFKRAGLSYWEVWKWDPNATSPTGVKGNFAPVATLNWDKVMCGSLFGAAGPCS